MESPDRELTGERRTQDEDVKRGETIVPIERKTSRQGVVRQTLRSQSFIEKLVLLFLTVIISGIAVPLVINYFDSKAAEREKKLEEMKARNTAILQAQSRLLDEFSEIVLTYETLALDVSWYKTKIARNEEMHEKAFTRYSERMVDLVSKWRALISRAQTLTDPSTSKKIHEFLLKVFYEQDTPINQLYINKASTSQWEMRHNKSEGMLSEANKLIKDLAIDLGLSKKVLSR